MFGLHLLESSLFTLRSSLFTNYHVQKYAMFSILQTLACKNRRKSLSNRKNTLPLHRFSRKAPFRGVAQSGQRACFGSRGSWVRIPLPRRRERKCKKLCQSSVGATFYFLDADNADGNYSAKDFYYKNAETRRRREAFHSTKSILSAQSFGQQVSQWHTSKRSQGVLLSKSLLNSKKKPLRLSVSAFEIKEQLNGSSLPL